jgi:acetyl-CoA acetyltransferase
LDDAYGFFDPSAYFRLKERPFEMSNPPEIPIVVGIGDINDRAAKGRDDAAEPLTLMLRAIGAAIQDTTLAPEAAQRLQAAIESVAVIANWTWPYPNTPELVAQRLGLSGPVHTHESHHGGDSPGALFDEAARRVAYKKSKVAIVTGGEALASCLSLEQ